MVIIAVKSPLPIPSQFPQEYLGPGHSLVLPVLSLHLDQGLNFQWKIFMGTLKASALGFCVKGKTKR